MQEYLTTDLHWAAALVACRYPILGITESRGQTSWHFERTEAMNNLRIAWANKTLTVSAREYADALQMLKSTVVRSVQKTADGRAWRTG